MPNDYSIFPTINATLNGTSAVLLVTAHQMIHRGRMAAHRALMLTAVVTSSLFLTSYLYYHWHVGSVRFQGHGWSRPVYFSILISHTILAIDRRGDLLHAVSLVYGLKVSPDLLLTISCSRTL